MSSISSIGSNQDLVQMLQQTQSQGSTAKSRQNDRAEFEAKAQAAGIDIKGLKSLHSEMKSAVQDALKNADPSADRQATIQSAIEGVLKSHGYDPAKLKSQFEAAGLKAPGQYDATGKVPDQRQNVRGPDADRDNDGSTAIAGVLQQADAGSLVDVAA